MPTPRLGTILTVELALEVAELKRRLELEAKTPDDKKGITPQVMKILKVNPSHVALVDKWVEDGSIKFVPDTDEAAFTMPFEVLMSLQRETHNEATEVADTSSAKTYLAQISTESKDRVDQYIILGKVMWQVLERWAIKNGMGIEEIANLPPHKILEDALDAYDMKEVMENEISALRKEILYWRGEGNALERLKRSITIANENLKTLLLIKMCGGDWRPVARIMSKMLNDYVLGKPLDVEEMMSFAKPPNS